MSYSASGAQDIGEESVEADSAEISVASEGRTTVSYYTKDAAGNIENKASVTVGIDKTAPNVDCVDPEDSWHKADVSISCSASDSVSGLKDVTMADFFLSTAFAKDPVVAGEEKDDASTNSRDVCDKAGNCKNVGPTAFVITIGPECSARNAREHRWQPDPYLTRLNAFDPRCIDNIKVDKKAPVIKMSKPADGAMYTLGEPVYANYHCTDGGSGVEACGGSMATKGSRIDTTTIASRFFDVNAKDKAGNTTSAAHSYSVIYDFVSNGSIQLVEDPPSKLYDASGGDNVLVTFRLGGYNGLDLFAECYPLSREIKCPERGPSTTIVGSNMQFIADSGSGAYTYTWNTNEAWSGTCRRLLLRLDDGTQHSADFRFTR